VSVPSSFQLVCITSRLSYMVQMHFETVSHSKSFIALNDFPEYVPDHITIKLVAASQANANHLILHILSISCSEAYLKLL
jgi:hypothetical protein